MRISACFSHWEGTQKSWFSTYSTSVQVSYYWCHRESWQLLLLRSQRLQDELIRHAAESKTRPGLERREQDTASQKAWFSPTQKILKQKQKHGMQEVLIQVLSMRVSSHIWQACVYSEDRENRKLSQNPDLRHAYFMLQFICHPSQIVTLISTLKFFLFKINMIQFL